MPGKSRVAKGWGGPEGGIVGSWKPVPGKWSISRRLLPVGCHLDPMLYGIAEARRSIWCAGRRLILPTRADTRHSHRPPRYRRPSAPRCRRSDQSTSYRSSNPHQLTNATANAAGRKGGQCRFRTAAGKNDEARRFPSKVQVLVIK